MASSMAAARRSISTAAGVTSSLNSALTSAAAHSTAKIAATAHLQPQVDAIDRMLAAKRQRDLAAYVPGDRS